MSIFTKVKIPKRRRSNFDLSHEVKTTSDIGRLTPILLQEGLPGDTFKVSTNIFARMAPMLAPIMSRVDVYTHFFFVPSRLLWDNFEDFITGGENGTLAPELPYITYQTVKSIEEDASVDGSPFMAEGTLMDYFGLPIGSTAAEEQQLVNSNIKLSLLPFKAYQKIYNDWYRDQNIENEIDILKDSDGNQYEDGHDNSEVCELLKIRYRAWQKDYFTSALPWAQRGPEVTLPFHGNMQVNTDPSKNQTIIGSLTGRESYLGRLSSSPNLVSGSLTNDTQGIHYDQTSGNAPSRVRLGSEPYYVNPEGHGPTINELRRSIRVQEWLEATARGGARYIEQLLMHFGVRSSDARLQRAELLGGGKSPIMISEVLQNSASVDGENPLGSMAGHGVTAQSTHGFKKYIEEHGYIIGIMSILPKATYQQGISRLWTRYDKFDYAWPEFANIGEQEILNRELYVKGDASDDGVFGYAPRYSEYKYQPSTIHGAFRSSMAFWHLGRIFKNQPKLNADFIKVDNPEEFSRIFADQDPKDDHFWMQIYHNITAKRVLPYYGTPQI